MGRSRQTRLTPGVLSNESLRAVYSFSANAGDQSTLLPDFNLAFGSAEDVQDAVFATYALIQKMATPESMLPLEQVLFAPTRP